MGGVLPLGRETVDVFYISADIGKTDSIFRISDYNLFINISGAKFNDFSVSSIQISYNLKKNNYNHLLLGFNWNEYTELILQTIITKVG